MVIGFVGDGRLRVGEEGGDGEVGKWMVLRIEKE